MTGTTRQVAVGAAALFGVRTKALAGVGALFDEQAGAVSDSVPTRVRPPGGGHRIRSVVFKAGTRP